MSETVQDVPKPEVDTVEESEGDGKMEDSGMTEAAAVSSVSAAGDVGSDAADVDSVEPAAVDSTSVEDEKHVIDESDAVEAAVMPEADAADESAGDAAATAVGADENVAVVISEAETDECKEAVAAPTDDEIMTAVSPSTDSVDEKPDDSHKADAEASADATTDRVEHVTCKADKVTVSVELPTVVEVSQSVEVSSVDTATVEAKSEVCDSGVVAPNKTTQDVMNMAGNNELKFGMLIGLVRVGQLSNKDVVDSVLCLVSTIFLFSPIGKSCRKGYMFYRP